MWVCNVRVKTPLMTHACLAGLHRGLLELVRIPFWSNGKGPLILALFAAKKVDSGIAVEERGQFILVNNP